MASLLIYPRYKIHQLSSTPGEPLFDTLRDASNRLRNIIMSPSIVLVWVFGLLMVATNPGLVSSGWMQLKFVLVLVLSGVHGYFVKLGKRIDTGETGLSGKRMRILNEVPFLLMIGVVILVVIKPF